MNHIPSFLPPASVSLRVILAEDTPALIRAREAARFLHTHMEAGHFRRLSCDDRRDLRAVIMGLTTLAEQLEPVRAPRSRDGWWDWALGWVR